MCTLVFPRLPQASPITDTWCYRVTNKSCSLSPAGSRPLGESCPVCGHVWCSARKSFGWVRALSLPRHLLLQLRSVCLRVPRPLLQASCSTTQRAVAAVLRPIVFEVQEEESLRAAQMIWRSLRDICGVNRRAIIHDHWLVKVLRWAGHSNRWSAETMHHCIYSVLFHWK